MSILRAIVVLLLLASASAATASTTSFHYAGTLVDLALPDTSGNYDFRVRLFDGAGAGAHQVGSDVLVPAVPVLEGFFSIDLDFGSAVLTPSGWLEFAVKPSGGATYETLSPRQQIGHVPLALYAESTDWSGVANVPKSLLALTSSQPPVIGKLVFTPSLNPAPNGLVVHKIALTTSRTVSVSGTTSAPSFNGFEAWVEPGLAAPVLMLDLAMNTTIETLDVFLSVAGDVDETPPFLQLSDGVQVIGMSVEPGSDGNADLLHLTFMFGKVSMQGDLQDLTTSYSYDLRGKVASAVPDQCPVLLSTLQFPFAVGSAGIVTLATPDVLDAASADPFNIDPGAGGNPPTFKSPQWSTALDPAHATASRTLATCGLAMATTPVQALANPVTWTEFPSGASKANGWTTRLSWSSAVASGYTLGSDLDGTIKVSVQFVARKWKIASKLAGDPESGAGTSCWDLATNQPCS